MWLAIAGIFFLLLAGVVESYCAVSRQCLPSLRARIFDTHRGLLLNVGWVVLLVVGALLLIMVNWILAVVGVVVFWVLLPIWLMPMLKKRLLPPWDLVKSDLERHGYTEDNYLDGDWWKKGRSQEIELHLKGK